MNLAAVGFARNMFGLKTVCLPHQPDTFLGHPKTGVQISDEAVKCQGSHIFVDGGHILRRHNDVEFLTGNGEDERLARISKITAIEKLVGFSTVYFVMRSEKSGMR